MTSFLNFWAMSMCPLDSLSPINLLPLSTLHSQYCMLSLLKCKSAEMMTKQCDNQEQHQHQSRLSAIKELYKTNKQTISTSQSYFLSSQHCTHESISPLESWWHCPGSTSWRGNCLSSAASLRWAPSLPCKRFYIKIVSRAQVGQEWKMIPE